MLKTVLLSAMSYVGTNIDDILVDTLFFAATNSPKDTRRIVIGKYLGVGLLVVLSLLGAFGLQLLPERYLGLLGLVPLAMGIKAIADLLRGDGEEAENTHIRGNLTLTVMLVTLANGGDNLGVYIPLFAGFSVGEAAVMLATFFCMVAAFCFLGKKIAELPPLRRFLTKHRKAVVPVVYLALGAYILLDSFLCI